MQVLLARFFLAAGAVQSNRFTAKIGGCCVWDFPVFGAIDHYIVNSNFHFMDISILDVRVRAGGHSVGGDADLQ